MASLRAADSRSIASVRAAILARVSSGAPVVMSSTSEARSRRTSASFSVRWAVSAPRRASSGPSLALIWSVVMDGYLGKEDGVSVALEAAPHGEADLAHRVALHFGRPSAKRDDLDRGHRARAERACRGQRDIRLWNDTTERAA